QPFIELGELLELGEVATERALARFPDREELPGEGALLRFRCRASPPPSRRRLEDPAFERHARFVLRIEHGIARDEKRVLSTTEAPAFLSCCGFEDVKRLVRG